MLNFSEPKILIDDLVADREFAASLCPPSVNISWIVHGWMEGYSIQTAWIRPVIKSTLNLNGGCVIVMDYSFYSGYGKGYGEIVHRYPWLRDVLVNALKMFGEYSRMHVFGFSFGSRLAQGAGNVLTDENNGIPVIASMDLCDPAGPDFDGNSRRVPCRRSAINVASIHTSEDYGTRIYDCHQNFRMGHCGKWQDGSTVPPKRSHGMCPYIYNFSFTNDYRYNPLYENECRTPITPVNSTCKEEMIVGPRNSLRCFGDINVPTSKCAPFVYNGVIDNSPCSPY